MYVSSKKSTHFIVLSIIFFHIFDFKFFKNNFVMPKGNMSQPHFEGSVENIITLVELNVIKKTNMWKLGKNIFQIVTITFPNSATFLKVFFGDLQSFCFSCGI